MRLDQRSRSFRWHHSKLLLMPRAITAGLLSRCTRYFHSSEPLLLPSATTAGGQAASFNEEICGLLSRCGLLHQPVAVRLTTPTCRGAAFFTNLVVPVRLSTPSCTSPGVRFFSMPASTAARAPPSYLPVAGYSSQFRGALSLPVVHFTIQWFLGLLYLFTIRLNLDYKKPLYKILRYSS